MDGPCSTYGEGRGAYKVLMGKTEERDHLEDLILEGSIIFIYIFKKWNWVA